MTTSTSTEVALVTTATREKIEAGTITMADLVKEIAPAAPAEEVPENIPLPAQITSEQRAALERLAEVFGSVEPTERRALEPTEIRSLIEERLTLDEIEKMASGRKDSIKRSVHNHLDVVAEREGSTANASRHVEGHYILGGKTGGHGASKQFVREVREQKPKFVASNLTRLVDEGVLDRADYLAMTTQVRVVDEHKIMLLLKKRPDLLSVLVKATEPGSTTAAITVRKV
jgi:hypothetical protein